LSIRITASCCTARLLTERRAKMPDDVARAAGVIARSPSGRVLLMNRVDGAGWAWPSGGIEGDETAEQCAWRGFHRECGYRLGSVGAPLMRRVKDDGDGLVDFATFVVDVPEEFVPRLSHKYSGYGWFDPCALLEEAKALIDVE
jgi:8-oxo-dGTP pyrophosphatase MutT (NUDIX family)